MSVTHKVLKSCRSKMATLVHDVWDVHGAFSLYKNLLAKFIQDFPYWRDGGVPQPTKNLLIHPLHTKFLFPPTKSQFNPIKKIKASFLAVVIAPVPFFLISYSFETQILLTLIFDFNWCSVLTKCCFYLWKIFKSSKSLLLRFSPPGKKILPAVFPTFWHKVREARKSLGEKEQ